MSNQKNGSNQELVEQNNQKLNQYAEELNKLHTDIAEKEAVCCEHGKVVLNLAHQAGNILLKAQELVPHGKWEKWVEENVKGIGIRTAQNYMKLAFEINHREEVIRSKKSGTKLVSFLDEVQNLREAYRVIGIIKNGFRKTDFTEKEPSPEKIKGDNPELYEEKLAKARTEIIGLVQTIIKDSKEAKWDVSQWTIDEKGNPRFRDQGTKKCLRELVWFITSRNQKEITYGDETENKAGAVLRELIKTIIQATYPAKPEPVKPEDLFFQLGDKTIPVIEVVSEKIAA